MRGRDIKRYGYEFADLWLICAHNGVKEKWISRIDINDYPVIKAHLDLYITALTKRTDKGDTPYNLRSCAYIDDFSKQKIIYIEIMTDNPSEGYDFPCFSFDENGCVLLNTAYMMIGKVNTLKYILAILNSKLGRHLVKLYVMQLQNKQFRMLHQSVVNFPIPSLCEVDMLPYIQSANYILQNKNDQIEDQLNKMIYRLYELTRVEIDFIEFQ